MQFSTRKITVDQDLGSRKLQAYYDCAFLWSKAPIDPGCADEVAEFYTVTLIRFLEVLETLSAHQRLELLERSRGAHAPRRGDRQVAMLGEYPDAQ
ncbi:hypothetical protein [Citreimonas salinaria]|nr:hypothetical protein [Citreimonas salinaria]